MSFLEFLDLSNVHCLFAIFISIANAILLVLISQKFFQILQITGYKVKGYNHWLKDTKGKYISRITMLSFLSLCCVLVTNFLFDVYNSEALFSYLGLIFYIYFTIVFVINANKSQQKTPLVQTRRMSRLTTVMFLISFVITFVLIWLATVLTPFLRFGIIVLTPLLTPILVICVHFLMIPLESLIRYRYIVKAKRRLKSYPNLIKIGITGSYGKTSVKYILNKILSEKYNVCMTPHSFNTPMGLTKVVLKYLKKDNEVLIAEMGAKQQGDIAYLCKLIEPQHAILTSVGNQHYETFGSKEAIAQTKYELINSLPESANAVFNIDSTKCKELFEKCTLKNKFAVSLDNESEIFAENVEISKNGIKFDLKYKNEKVECETELLGRHNLTNILLACCLAVKLGITLPQISNALKELEPINHRLELIQNGNVSVLDDAYSTNEEGAKNALEVLNLFDEEIKICITPGIVEMGAKEFEANVSLGSELAKTCNKAIIVNKVNAEAIKKALTENNFPEKNMIFVESLESAKLKLADIIKESSEKNPSAKFAVLFLNDLPDSYI